VTDGDTDIRQLDDTTVERIAAGEVVERPASAVKELVENAVDASAERIEVAVDGDGTDRLAVRDDGHGMTEADVRAAVRAHTTSKLSGPDDLESGLATLGFRGEALHTIGAVARLTIRTRPADGDGAGTELVYEGGDLVSVEPCGCPRGTSVVVEDLFYNTPARREYLATEATEFARINRVVTNYALANPDVAVSLTHDDRETFATDGQGSLRSAVLAVYGRDVAEAMVPVDADGDPAAPLSGVSGLVSHPETNRSTATYCSTFVNGRYVESETVREAVLAAYGGQLAGDRYPFAVLNLDLPADTVDVNVHPRKMAVRFQSADAVREQVRAAIEAALVEAGLTRSSAPRGTSKAAETDVRPERPDGDERDDGDGDDTASADGPTAGGDGDAAASAGDHAAGGPTDVDRTATTPDDRATVGAEADDTGGANSPDPSIADAPEDPPDSGATSSRTRSDDSPATADPPASGGTKGSGDATDADGTDHDTDDRDAPEADPAHSYGGAGRQRTLAGDAVDTTPSVETLPSLRVLGQFDDTYLVCEGEAGLLLVDQHAADERVNYERLRTALAGTTTAQELATPVELSVTAGEAAALSAHRDALERVGFRATLAGDHAVRVAAVPAVFAETLPPETVRDVLATFVGRSPEGAGDAVDELTDELLADLACHPSITGNTSLTEGSAMDLLSALDDCENPYACPHGRPVIVELDREEIETRFERDYPGHE
jgi:DNA mismatch repair protein MutL